MSSATGQGTCEKGTVARMVDRLSKQDFNALTRTENVPLRNSRGSDTGGVGSGGVGFHTSDESSANSVDNASVAPKQCAIVRFSYTAQQPDELDLKEGDELAVIELVEDGWARGCILQSTICPNTQGRTGLYPTNFVSTVSPTPTVQTTPVTAQSCLALSTSPFPTGPDDKQQPPQENNRCGVGIPLSNSTPKTTSSPVSTSPIALTNGSGVVHVGNVLPSSLLKAAASVGGNTGGARRVVSTLITSTTTATASPTTESVPLQIQTQIQPKSKEFAKVLYKYEATNPDELTLPEGAIVTIINRQCDDEGWFIAECDGRRGLFPDNFVRFLEHGHSQPSSNTQPPTLPAKPSKFCSGVSTTVNNMATSNSTAPIVNARETLNNSIKSSSITAANAQHQSQHTVNDTPAPAITLKTTTLHNNNEALKTNNASNRRSMIEGLQKQLFPSGKLPPQRPQQPSLSGAKSPIGNMDAMLEPKPSVMEGVQSTKLLDANSSIVKSRTKIAPMNKRPPSKVNSAAALLTEESPASSLPESSSPHSNFVTKDTAPQLQTTSHPVIIPPTAPRIPTTATTTTAPMISSFSAQSPSSPTAGNPLFGSQPSPLLCAISAEERLQSGSKNSRAHSSSVGCNSGSSSSSVQQWISRAEFKLYKEEQERKLEALHAELEELRRRLENST